MEAEAELQEEPQEESQEESQKEEPQKEEEDSLLEPKKRGRPRMTPEQKKEAKAARNRLKVVETKPQKAESSQKAGTQKTKIIERVVREYVEVPVPAVQQSPFESIGNVLRSRAVSEYERKKQQWASFQLI